MKKLLSMLLIFSLSLFILPAHATEVSRFFTYATTSQVTSTNLNGNYDNLVTVINGGLDNTNADTTSGFRFFEVLGALPAASTQGRVIFLTTDNSLNFDTGSTFIQSVTVSGTPAQGDIAYHDGTSWAKLAAGTSGEVLETQGTGTNPQWSDKGKVVQRVKAQITSSSTGTTALPGDDSIPQNDEGDEYMTLTITPTSATNKLEIDVVWMGSHTADTLMCVALFQDSTANAIDVGFSNAKTSGCHYTIAFSYDMLAGTTSATTFKVRAGGNTGSTTTFNGVAGGRLYGGVASSSITIKEIIP